MKMKIGQIAGACLLLVAAGSVMASSHREAPFITTAPKVDGTDFYMFNSYEAGKTGNVTMIANYLPLQDAYGGPNYFSLDPNALYEIHLDNNGDGKEDLTFQFQFKNELAANGAGITLPIGGKNVSIPLRQAGPVTNAAGAPLSYTESFTLNVVRGDRRSGKREAVTTAGGSKTFGKPIDYIGTKTFPNNSYEGYANSYIQTINIPGCATPGKVFVGQRKEAFSVNLGVIFDLVNAPASFITNEANAAAGGKFGELENKNVTSLALEVPASCLTQVNEVVIGLKDKDKFNGSKPVNDAANFADYVTNPTLPALLEKLFGAKAPTNFPRTDLMTAFLTGLPTVNRPANITGLGMGGPLTEMLRLNTSIASTPAASQKSLGVAAGDNAGFPNGRRLGDDVVDVSLRVAMGALCVLTGDADALKVGCKPADAPAGGVAFVDGVRASATDFQQVFPYLNTPLPGAK